MTYWGQGGGRGRGGWSFALQRRLQGGGRGRGRGSSWQQSLGWEPETRLGKVAKEGNLRQLEQAFLLSLPIREWEILAYSDLTLGSEVLFIETLYHKAKAARGRNFLDKTSVRCAVAVGDRNGHVGVAVHTARDRKSALVECSKKAGCSIMPIRRGYYFKSRSGEPTTVAYKVSGESGGVVVHLYPAPKGTGVVCASAPARTILELAGIADVTTKVSSGKHSPHNVVMATVDALANLSSRARGHWDWKYDGQRDKQTLELLMPGAKPNHNSHNNTCPEEEAAIGISIEQTDANSNSNSCSNSSININTESRRRHKIGLATMSSSSRCSTSSSNSNSGLSEPSTSSGYASEQPSSSSSLIINEDENDDKKKKDKGNFVNVNEEKDKKNLFKEKEIENWTVVRGNRKTKKKKEKKQEASQIEDKEKEKENDNENENENEKEKEKEEEDAVLNWKPKFIEKKIFYLDTSNRFDEIKEN